MKPHRIGGFRQERWGGTHGGNSTNIRGGGTLTNGRDGPLLGRGADANQPPPGVVEAVGVAVRGRVPEDLWSERRTGERLERGGQILLTGRTFTRSPDESSSSDGKIHKSK